jgi:hypothetical protein
MPDQTLRLRSARLYARSAASPDAFPCTGEPTTRPRVTPAGPLCSCFTDPKKNIRYTYLTPREAQIALINFDRGVMPNPFGFMLRSAVVVTRTKGRAKGKPKRTREERNAKLLRNHKLRTQHERASASAMERDELYAPDPKRVDTVIRALDDPRADLGPAIAITPAGANNRTSHPVIVGGRPPATVKLPGNLARTRRFGIRQYLE